MRTVLTALVIFSSALAAAPAGAAARPARRVSVQPFDGDVGPLLRDDVVRSLRAHGFDTVTDIPRTDATGPYLSLARDLELNAFVTGDVEARGAHRSITFLVWNGATGSVVGRWSAACEQKQIRRAVARGFWKHLGRALAISRAPRRHEHEMRPGPTMYIDAGYDDEKPIRRRAIR